ncbi:hypothetical protein [Streptomyces sp. NPDC020996]|uniref:hypothetical protein n=1 Tax=Streptomyces sp. NPDC020996 TaxID=3154791 RepID=UPI003404B21C
MSVTVDNRAVRNSDRMDGAPVGRRRAGDRLPERRIVEQDPPGDGVDTLDVLDAPRDERTRAFPSWGL